MDTKYKILPEFFSYIFENLILNKSPEFDRTNPGFLQIPDNPFFFFLIEERTCNLSEAPNVTIGSIYTHTHTHD